MAGTIGGIYGRVFENRYHNGYEYRQQFQQPSVVPQTAAPPQAHNYFIGPNGMAIPVSLTNGVLSVIRNLGGVESSGLPPSYQSSGQGSSGWTWGDMALPAGYTLLGITALGLATYGAGRAYTYFTTPAPAVTTTPQGAELRSVPAGAELV